MNFFSRWLYRLGTESEHREIDQFLGSLSTLDNAQMAELLACVVMLRHGMEAQGVAPLNPFEAATLRNPGIATDMARMARGFKKTGALTPALAATVWGHTFRSVLSNELRPKGKLIWRELQRGLPGVAAAAKAQEKNGISIAVYDAHEIPLGFES